jgi:hypothetical protein
MDIFSFANGTKYLHYDKWVQYRKELCDYYPLQKGHFRADIELIRPALFLNDVKIDRNPHSFYDAILFHKFYDIFSDFFWNCFSYQKFSIFIDQDDCHKS